ncbi:hypothetical protein Tco_0476230 [Tanacetum coccineum]
MATPSPRAKTSATKYSSKGKSPATSLKSSKSSKSAKDQVKEPIFVQNFDYADMPRDQGEVLGKTVEQPNDEAVYKNDWYKKPSSDTSPDPEWNEGKSVDDEPEQIHLARIVIQARVEDLQLGVESYQKKLNLTKPRTQDVDMSRIPVYTTLSNPQGVIYKDNMKRKRFMRADELHKFSDGTLISVRDTLSQMLYELHLGYNKTKRRRQWTSLDRQRTRIMIKSFNQNLLDRRIMRSLKKFVGGREYEEDLRLLQRII